MFNLRQYLQNLDGFRETGTSDEVRINCIRCGDRKSHLYFGLSKGLGKCFKCQHTYNVLRFVTENEDITIAEAYKFINSQTTVSGNLEESINSLNETYAGKELQTFANLAEVFFPREFRRVDSSAPESVLKYLSVRQLAFPACERYNIHYCLLGLYANRLIIPITMHHKRVSFVARDYTNNALHKVLYPTGSEIASCLFNYDVAIKNDTVIIVEGVFDAMRVGDNAVALFGKTVSMNQTELLIKGLFKKAIVMLDSDAALETIEICNTLKTFLEVKAVRLASGDPADKTKEEIKGLLDNAFGMRLQEIVDFSF